MKKILESVIKDLERLNWRNFETVALNTQKVLKEMLNNKEIISLLLENLLKNDKLISFAEHYDFFDKLVLYVDKKDRFRIRLHLFSGDKSTKHRPHHHRWVYSSVILRNGYKHFIYGTEEQINENTKIKDLKPIVIREEKTGSIYTLNHNVFHSIEAEPDTVSVIIRGPAIKDRFLIMDKKTNKKWWEYGRKSETIEEIKRKSLDINQIRKIIDKLYKLEVFTPFRKRRPF